MLVEVILLALIAVVIWNITKKPSDYPPGPWGLPLFGSLPLGQKNFERKLKELKKKHGKIFSWKIGSKVWYLPMGNSGTISDASLFVI
ncbi:hypothetical protein Avbf_05218 [Armadillidium vulgare]|nr:hypothetical protein Avbf_05218 [Armadillidium vulgare]